MIGPKDILHYKNEEEFQKRLVALGLDGLRGKEFEEVMQRCCDYLARQDEITSKVEVADVFIMLWLLDRAQGWKPSEPTKVLA